MKLSFALCLLATLCTVTYAASLVDPEKCQRPANITAVDARLSRGDFISNKELCGSTICVDAGQANLIGATSQICQDRKVEQGVFTCNRAKRSSKKESNTKGDIGYEFCSLPAKSRTVAAFQCPNGGASIHLYTTVDGKASFSVGKEKADQLGAAYFSSKAVRGCTPWSVTGTTDDTSDYLVIDCASKISKDCSS